MNGITQTISGFHIWDIGSGTIINLVLALACGVGIFIVHYITNRSLSVSQSFSYTLIMLPIVSAVIAIIINSNLILAVSMLGALSIIRFRHSMKDSKNLVFIFWAVTAGLTSGLSFRTLTVIWCTLTGIIALAIYFAGRNRYSAVLTVKTAGDSREVEDILQEFSISYTLKYKEKGENSHILFELKGKLGGKKAAGAAGVSGAARRDSGQTGQAPGDALCERISQLGGVFSVRFVELR